MNNVSTLLACSCLCAETTEGILDLCFEKAEQAQHQLVYSENAIQTAFLHGKIMAFDEIIYYIERNRIEKNDQ